ncbi:MAG: hypothetical protein RIQ71_1034, partial [Verrucomicrobiota bacterium]
YTHNGNSRLVGVSGPGSVTATFGRDGRNRDVKRTINGTTTYLIYDGWSLVAEYDAAGVLTTRYIHGPQVDEILAKVTTASTTFPLPDALGSTIAVTDASGAVLERVYYSDAFGTPTFQDAAGSPLAGTSTGTRFLFTGREWLAALNLYDYRNRTYSAELGRFIETDPIGFDAGDLNLYRYVANSPTVATDPSGKVLLPAAVTAAVAALKGLEHSICDKFAMDSAAQAKTDAEKHCLVSCNYSRCIGKTSGFLQGAVQSFIGGIIHEIIQTGSVGNTWQGAIADIRSNLVGIVGGLNPFSDCKSSCDPCKGKWNP